MRNYKKDLYYKKLKVRRRRKIRKNRIRGIVKIIRDKKEKDRQKTRAIIAIPKPKLPKSEIESAIIKNGAVEGLIHIYREGEKHTITVTKVTAKKVLYIANDDEGVLLLEELRKVINLNRNQLGIPTPIIASAIT